MKNRIETKSLNSLTRSRVNSGPGREVFQQNRNRERTSDKQNQSEFHYPQFSPSILLVDDDQSLRQMIAIFLVHHNFEVTQAGDGAEAWKHFGVRTYDVVVTDFELPHLSGIELLRRIRANMSGQPCILASGHIPRDQHDLDSLLHPGVALKKPYKIDTLLKAINQLIKSPSS